jgi:hypothetical protein
VGVQDSRIPRIPGFLRFLQIPPGFLSDSCPGFSQDSQDFQDSPRIPLARNFEEILWASRILQDSRIPVWIPVWVSRILSRIPRSRIPPGLPPGSPQDLYDLQDL